MDSVSTKPFINSSHPSSKEGIDGLWWFKTVHLHYTVQSSSFEDNKDKRLKIKNEEN